MTTKIDLIVTRHPTLAQLLIERGLADADTPVIEHATRADVRGKHIAGVLPHHLSSAAASVTEVPMRMSLEDRQAAAHGDLPLERVRKIAGDAVTYLVTAIDDPCASSLAMAAAIRECEGYHGVVDGPFGRLFGRSPTWRGLPVMYFGSMCQQFSAVVVLSRGIWMPRQIGTRQWLDGLGRPVDTMTIEGSAGWEHRLVELIPGSLTDVSRPMRFATKGNAWAHAEAMFGPDAAARVTVAPALDLAWE